MRTADQVVTELRSRGELWEPAAGLVALRGDAFALFSRIERLVATTAAGIGTDCDASCEPGRRPPRCRSRRWPVPATSTPSRSG